MLALYNLAQMDCETTYLWTFGPSPDSFSGFWKLDILIVLVSYTTRTLKLSSVIDSYCAIVCKRALVAVK